MISALRKIENRGELHAANSAVMEMCIDNPREGFADIFATHPPVDKRVEALVTFAGGHDPGLLALSAPDDGGQVVNDPPAGGPWGGGAEPADKPFLPGQPPVDPGGGPWGPRQR
jgi:heat shock protein HtpX